MGKIKIEKYKSALDMIEKAKTYSLLSKSYVQKAVYIGNRKKLAIVLRDIDPDMIIATTGTSDRCIILIDYTLGDMMDLIIRAKDAN